MPKRGKRLRLLGLAIITVACLVVSPVNAITPDQQDVFSSQGLGLFDVTPGACGGSGVTVPPGNLPSFIPEPYNGDFTAAGKAYDVSPVLIASIFTEEHFTNHPTTQLVSDWKGLPQAQPDPNSGWATSPDNAMGPFQFIPSTWSSLGVDADHNGVKDVENLLDASFGAAHYMAVDGATADKPKSVWVNFADGYSGHTAGYADQVSKYIDFYASGGTTPSTSGGDASSVDTSSCAAGAVNNNIVQTAYNFAWDDYPDGHNFTSKDPKPSYKAAFNTYESGTTSDTTDCGAFVATVMRSSGVDKNYPLLGTSNQLAYVQAHPELYNTTVAPPGEWQTSDLQPGDILIASVGTEGHTYIYLGPNVAKDGFTVAEASQFSHVPEVDHDPYPYQDIDGVHEDFYIVRFKGNAQ